MDSTSFSLDDYANRLFKGMEMDDDRVRTVTETSLKEAEQCTEDMFQEVAQTYRECNDNLPKVAREMEMIKQDGHYLTERLLQLQAECNAALMKQAAIGAGQSLEESPIGQLAKMDQKRRHLLRLIAGLEEHLKWLAVEENIDQFLSNTQSDHTKLCEVVADLAQGLASFQGTELYEARCKLLEDLRNNCEALLAPKLLLSLASTASSSESSSQSLVSLFAQIDRLSSAKSYYTRWLMDQLQTIWQEEINSSSKSVEESLASFYDKVARLRTQQLQVEPFDENQTEPLLMQAVTQGLNRLTQPIGEFLRQHTGPVQGEALPPKIRLMRVFLHTAQKADLANLDEACKRATFRPFQEIFPSVYESLIKSVQNGPAVVRMPGMDERTDELLAASVKCAESLSQFVNAQVDYCITGTAGTGLVVTLQHVMHTLSGRFCDPMGTLVTHLSDRLVEAEGKSGYESFQHGGLSAILKFTALTGWLALDVQATLLKLLHRLEPYLVVQQQVKSPSPDQSVDLGEALLMEELLTGQIRQAMLSYFDGEEDQLSRELRKCFDRVGKVLIDSGKKFITIPLKSMLAGVADAQVWSSRPATGDRVLSDMAYMPQEYMTHIGHYLMNVPEQLEAFLLASSPGNMLGSVQGAPVSNQGLAYMLNVESKSSVATLWFEMALSHWVMEVIMDELIYRMAPTLTDHGAKQLEKDLRYLESIFAELAMPTPDMLSSLCTLAVCPRDEFVPMSMDYPPRMVNQISRLRKI